MSSYYEVRSPEYLQQSFLDYGKPRKEDGKTQLQRLLLLLWLPPAKDEAPA